MNFFKRLYKMGQAEANSILDGMEDPIKLTEQGIRDLKIDLEESLETLAQTKAYAIRAKNEYKEIEAKIESCQEKAILYLNKAKTGDMDMAEAEQLAKEALRKKEQFVLQANEIQEESQEFEESVQRVEANVVEIKRNINRWENELKTLKARVRVSNATQKLNKQMADIDSSSTVAMLERMKKKVSQEEALAEAYKDISTSAPFFETKIDQEIDFTKDSADNELLKLKEQLGLSNKTKL